MIASKPRPPILFKMLLLFCLQLLDDNRELFIPETQDTVVAHPMFMLFATQNPPGHYGGRKVRNVCFLSKIAVLFECVDLAKDVQDLNYAIVS